MKAFLICLTCLIMTPAHAERSPSKPSGAVPWGRAEPLTVYHMARFLALQEAATTRKRFQACPAQWGYKDWDHVIGLDDRNIAVSVEASIERFRRESGITKQKQTFFFEAYEQTEISFSTVRMLAATMAQDDRSYQCFELAFDLMEATAHVYATLMGGNPDEHARNGFDGRFGKARDLYDYNEEHFSDFTDDPSFDWGKVVKQINHAIRTKAKSDGKIMGTPQAHNKAKDESAFTGKAKQANGQIKAMPTPRPKVMPKDQPARKDADIFNDVIKRQKDLQKQQANREQAEIDKNAALIRKLYRPFLSDKLINLAIKTNDPGNALKTLTARDFGSKEDVTLSDYDRILLFVSVRTAFEDIKSEKLGHQMICSMMQREYQIISTGRSVYSNANRRRVYNIPRDRFGYQASAAALRCKLK